ncbi:phosphatidate cytidylyltransferase [Methanocella arvoryzae]|uniref:Predicted phosphatidate cytidylyltransferase n=1 Tax=Methanocella arvoryzae (strain DSM 22066 / NBRC 105507 / MRE50) TaxID=351160 RepID=Q0W3N2_METAR|nr:phosphatidate cytidylyltransferase [Methanocella arvoryzae]CAJ37011.1 predicted phosphatidate cytidylyltransferase [Methanocella arvoryzae MRE50]
MFSLRKLVHMGGVLFVPLAMYNRYLALGMAILGIGAFFVLELVKRKLDPKLAGLVYRKGEMSGTATEPLAYLLAITLLLAISLLFMPEACDAAIIVLTLGDGVATLAGRAIGGPKLPCTKKTWSGMLAGIIIAGSAGYFVAGPIALVGAAGGMIAEAYAGRGDNCLTAIAAFLCMAAAAVITG